MMIKFTYFLQVFLQVIFAQIIHGSDIFQLRYNDLQSLLVNSRNNRNFQTLEDVLARDGAFVSTHSHVSPFLQEFNIDFIAAYKDPIIRNSFLDTIDGSLFAGRVRDAA